MRTCIGARRQSFTCVTNPFFLGDAIHANDLSSLFADGAIPQAGGNDGDKGNGTCGRD